MRIDTADLRPGDTVVVSVDGALLPSQAEELRASVSKEFTGHKVVVLTSGVRMSILRPSASS